MIDAATGYSSRDSAMRALKKLETFATSQPPNTKLRVVATGFSRGAATARHFLNLVYKSSVSGILRDLIPETWSYAILFDTVAAGQGDTLNLALPANVVLAIHYVAQNEGRPLFAPVLDRDLDFERVALLEGLDPPRRIWEIPVPGAHSDLGDSYLRGAGPLVTAYAQGVITSMGLRTPKQINLCSTEHSKTSVGPCRMIDEGLHDSRGIIDKLWGTRSAYRCGFKRQVSKTVSANIGKDEAIKLAEEIRQHRVRDFPDGLGSSIQTRSIGN